MKFESILEEINGFGPFQIVIMVLLCSPRIVLPCHFLLNNFIAAVPPHRCDVSTLDDGGLFTNLTHQQKLTVSVPLREDGDPRSCEMFAEPQFQLLYSGPHNGTGLPTVQCQSGWVYDNSTFTSTLATEWDLVCDRKSLIQTTGTIFFTGVMVGAVAFGFLCDKYGRRNTLLFSYVMATVFGFCSAFANSFVLFAVLRFFTGFGLTGISITSTVLSIEWVDIDHRSSMGVIGSLAWSVGNMLLAGFALLVPDWRMLILTVTAPLGFAILTWRWIPESARWLLANGKVEKAQFYLDKCAKFNKKTSPSANFKLKTLSTKMAERQDKNYTYLDLIKTRKMRHLSLLTGIVWYGVASTYYGISLNISGFGLNMYLTHFIYAAIEVPAKLMIYCLINIIGRRKCQGGTLLLTGTCIAINIFLPQGLWHLRAVVAILGKGLSEASFTTIYLYTTELYPTVVRQNGLGYTSFVSRVGVSVAPLILLLEDVWTVLPQIIICSVAIMSGLVALLLPETLNTRLPETIEDIEKPSNNAVSSDCEEASGVFLGSKSIIDTQQQ